MPNAVPRLLVATDNRFWRASIGSQVRVQALVAYFRAQGWAVDVAFQGRPYGEDVQEVQALDGIRVHFLQAAAEEVSGGRKPGPLLRLRAVTGRVVRQGLALCREVLRPAAERAGVPVWREARLRARERGLFHGRDMSYLALLRRLGGDGPRIVLVEYLRMAWVIEALRPAWPGARWLVDTHDVMHERQRRFHAVGEVHDLDVSAHDEASWLSRFDAVLAIQQRDAESFRAMGVTAPVLTVPHPVSAFPVPTRAGGLVGVGFLGSDMSANRLAVEELVFQVWPQVLQAVPDNSVALFVAGSVCDVFRGKALPPQVTLMGFVRDTRDFYAEVDVIAAPIRIGGGLKIKNVEAMCRGKTVVTTAVGAEGLERACPEALEITESVAAMAGALARLVVDPGCRNTRMAAALAFAETTFSSRAVFRSLDALVLPCSAPAEAGQGRSARTQAFTDTC